MQKTQYRYLIHLQYLGFRFHGWAKQEGLKTLHQMLDKTLSFVLPHSRYKTLGASRTDAMVSANHAAVALFVDSPLELEPFLVDLNRNFPPDIRALRVEEVGPNFNILQSPKLKEYLYLFSFGEKFHPFSAALMVSFPEDLNLRLMQQGAKMFEGKHDFRRYCTKPSAATQFEREIVLSEIVENEVYTANFFPEKSYVFRVRGKGFMRNQVRLMMGALVAIGLGEMSLEELAGTLRGEVGEPLRRIAPASGLVLNEILFGEG